MGTMGSIDVLAPEIACPRCHGPLQETANGLICPHHARVGQRGALDVLEFEDDVPYWGEIRRDSMRRLNATAHEHGWQRALERDLAPEHPGLVPYVQHPARADWRVLLPLRRHSTVSLDIGAGWGAISFGLAPHVFRHYAVERIAERVEFIAIRKLQDGVDNLVPVRADLHSIPIAPHSLDLISVNGVLEWAGLVDPQPSAARDPRTLQEAFLDGLRLLLRPGGWLYVGIENRFGRLFWQGAADHQGLRYTSLMPRTMARAYTRLRAAHSPRTYVTEHDYRTWTYSLRGYTQLFERCGFENLRSYAVVPGYNAPMQLIPIETTGPFLYLATLSRSPRVVGKLRRAAHLAARATGLERQITSSYVFVAQAPGGGAG